MGKFNEYTQKATPADNDTLMIYDAAAKANKLSPFSGIWNWIVGKLTNAVISNLQTNNKSVVGALNELNSKTLSLYGRGIRNIGASRKTITIHTNSINEQCFFVILAGATDTRCVILIYGLKASSDEVNYTDIINNKVSFSGSREDNTITINSGNWSRGMIYSYEPFTVETT